ncbi:MAG: biopolymer transport protein ExbB/TolQ [Myxococcota bacterium]|jgi:biopolymer transport protein ExbB/TolQ
MLTEQLSRFFDYLGVEWVMYLLIFLGFGAVFVIIERARFYASRRIDIAALTAAVRQALEIGDRDGAIELALRVPSMEGRVVASGIQALDQGAAAVEEVVQGALITERVEYDRYLPYLGTLGNNAPFIGLFGTVLGIIAAFADLASLGQGTDRANAIMGSIAAALVATAIGLLVAIPAVIAYNQFKGIIKERAGRADALTRVLLAHLKDERRGKH